MTPDDADFPPRPRRRLWNTFFKKPRDLTRFAPPIPFGAVARPDPDPEVLARWGQYTLLEDRLAVLHRDGTTSYSWHGFVVVHSPASYTAWDLISRPFDKRAMRVTVRGASVRAPGRRPVPVPVHTRMTDRAGNNLLLEAVFAPLRPGATVELAEQHDFFSPDHFGPGMWGELLFHQAAPCRRRRFTLAVARPFALQLELHNGAPAPRETRAGDYRAYVWDLADLPGVEADPVTPPPRDFAPWVDYSALPSWRPVAKKYAGYMVWPAPGGPAVTTLAKQLTVNAGDEGARARAVYEYAAREVRYGRPEREKIEWASRHPDVLTGELRGDCKDKSALLVALLGAVGVPARFALVSAAHAGRRPLLPSPRFNHALVVAQLDGREVWLEPAIEGFTFGDLPSPDQGVHALVLGGPEPEYRLVPGPEPEQHRVERSCRGRLGVDGGYAAEVVVRATGDLAARLRTPLLGRDGTTVERMLKQHAAGELPGAAVRDLWDRHVTDLGGDAAVGFSADLPGVGRRVGGLMLVRIPWLHRLHDTGFFGSAERSQPLTNPVYRVTDRHEIELPPDWSSYGPPVAASLSCCGWEYRYSVQMANDRLVCEREYGARGGHVAPDAYADLREFWLRCMRLEEAEIVLTTGEPGV
jgi:hypothetical protein